MLSEHKHSLPRYTVSTPNGVVSFVRESDADLTTPEGRIIWFCAHFEVDPPVLEYDREKPSVLMLTDELTEWTFTQGVNLDWLFYGKIAGPVAAFRISSMLRSAR